MQWMFDLINPRQSDRNLQEWLQLMSFLAAVFLSFFAMYLVMQGAIRGQNAMSLMLGLVLIFMGGSGLIALGRVSSQTQTAVARQRLAGSTATNLPRCSPHPVESVSSQPGLEQHHR